MKNNCRCFIYHFNTPEERKQGLENLKYFRQINDKTGIMITLAQLGSCPNK